MNQIRTVFFDAGFTLIRIAPSLGTVYARVAERLGILFPAARFQEVGLRVWRRRELARYREDLRSSDAIERRFWQDYNRIIARELEGEGFRIDFEAWFEALFRDFARPETWAPLPGVVETVEALAARGYALGVISNWDSRLRSVLDGLDLSRHFRLVLTSAEAGFRKPSPRIFAAALARLETPPSACVHVGDSEEDDVAGARAAGLVPVRLRSGTGPVASAATHVIRSLPELLELLP